MKSLILSKAVHQPDKVTQESHRFSLMINALGVGGIEAHHAWVETLEDVRDGLDQYQPDIVFNTIYSVRDGENSSKIIHEYFDENQVTYIGSPANVLRLALSKAALKDHWQTSGIVTPDYYVVRKTPDGNVHGLDAVATAKDFPYILKPSKEGNSRGISQRSIITDTHMLMDCLLSLLSRYDEILVEKYLGTDPALREFTVALIGNGPQRLIMPCEIVLKPGAGYRVITTADKEEHRTQAFAVGDPLLYDRLITLAERAFVGAGVLDYARFDVLLSADRFYAIEINGQPMVPDRWFEACARGSGLDAEQYLNAIFLAGIARNSQKGHCLLQTPGKMVEALPGDIYRRLNRVT